MVTYITFRGLVMTVLNRIFLTILLVVVLQIQLNECVAQDWMVSPLIQDSARSTVFVDIKSDNNGRFVLSYPAGSPGSGSFDFRVYAQETLDGIDWAEPEFIRDVPGNNQFADLAFDDDNLGAFTWRRQRPDGNLFDIWFAREIEPGFWEAEQVTDDRNDDARPQLALLPDGRAVIIYPRSKLDGPTNNMDIAISIETTGGWNSFNLMDDDVDDHRPAIFADNQGIVHLFYPTHVGDGPSMRTGGDWDLIYRTLDGDTLSEPLNLTQALNLPDKTDWLTVVQTPNGVIHAFSPGGDSAGGEERRVVHLSLTAGVWQADILQNEEATDPHLPAEWLDAVVGADGSIHVVYQAGKVFRQPGVIPTVIMYHRMRPDGVWDVATEIEDEWDESENPSVAISPAGRVIVVYNTKQGGINQLVSATYAYDAETAVRDWMLNP